MTIKLLTEHHLEFRILKGGCIGLSTSALVKKSHCWKSHVDSRGCTQHMLDIADYVVNNNIYITIHL